MVCVGICWTVSPVAGEVLERSVPKNLSSEWKTDFWLTEEVEKFVLRDQDTVINIFVYKANR